MHFAVGANGAAEGSVNLVVAQVHVDAARRTDRRGGRRIEFLLRPAIETYDGSNALTIPEPSDALQKRLGCNRAPEFQGRFGFDTLGGSDEIMLAALPAKRVPRRGIFHLLEAAVWTLHTNLERRLGHRLAALRLP